MSRIKKRPFRETSGLIPTELLGKKGVCPLCKTETEIPWLKKMEHPRQPIRSDVGSDVWVPIDFPLACSNEACKHIFLIETPALPDISRWSLYGDEAARYINEPLPEYALVPLNFYCLSLVALHNNSRERVKRKLFNIKRAIRPSVDPESWTHHFTEIWDSKPESDGFVFKSKIEKIEHAKKFAKIIRDANPHLAFFNFSSCVEIPSEKIDRRKILKEQMEMTFSEAIVSTLLEFRSQNKSVEWTFDNIQDASSGNKVEGWASERFLGLQYTPLFVWISSHAAVFEPSFVRPGSHFLLEIADFISYCVARDFQQSIMGKQSEFPSALLGKGFYQGTYGNGMVESMCNIGLPLKKFYGL